ncbi:MAG TPA: hypothetical protein VGK97_01530 [Spongiibacteraceae bacterium]|jgi:hypothetical protein
MRRIAVVAVLAAALVGAVGAESIIKARQANLPKGTITVEEVDSVVVEASRLNGANDQTPVAVEKHDLPARDVTYAMQ